MRPFRRNSIAALALIVVLQLSHFEGVAWAQLY
jgi:hypothetical protein